MRFPYPHSEETMTTRGRLRPRFATTLLLLPSIAGRLTASDLSPMTAEPSALAVVVPDNVDPSPDRSVALERDGSHRRLEDLDPSYDPGPFPECLGEIARRSQNDAPFPFQFAETPKHIESSTNFICASYLKAFCFEEQFLMANITRLRCQWQDWSSSYHRRQRIPCPLDIIQSCQSCFHL